MFRRVLFRSKIKNNHNTPAHKREQAYIILFFLHPSEEPEEGAGGDGGGQEIADRLRQEDGHEGSRMSSSGKSGIAALNRGLTLLCCLTTSVSQSLMSVFSSMP